MVSRRVLISSEHADFAHTAVKIPFTRWPLSLPQAMSARMTAVIAIGIFLTLIGLAGVLWCIRHASWLRKADLAEDRIKAELNKLIFAHMAAIGGAFLGLGLLLVGLLLR